MLERSSTRAVRIAILASLAFFPNAGLAQDAPKPPAEANQAVEFVRVGNASVGLPVDADFDSIESPPGLVWKAGDVLIIAWDLPSHPVARAVQLMTPDAVAKQLKTNGGATLVSSEPVELDGDKANLSRIAVKSDQGERAVLLLLVGDESFSTAIAAISRGPLRDEQVAKVRAHLLRASWSAEDLASTLTDNLDFTARVPAPLRFLNKSKNVSVFSDAQSERPDSSKNILLLLVEERKPARRERPAFNLSLAKGLASEIINVRAPKHEPFKLGDLPGLLTTVEGDGPNNSGERSAAFASIFLPDRVFIVEAVGPKARADEIAKIVQQTAASIERWNDAPDEPAPKAEEPAQK